MTIRDAIRDYLPWLLSAITIWMTLLAGNKHKSAWLVGLGNQVLWSAWIGATETWGLIPLNIALWVVYTRNHYHWNRMEDTVEILGPQREVTVQRSRALSPSLDSKTSEPHP